MWNLLFRSAACPKKAKPKHRVCWRLNLPSQTFNFGPISWSELYVTLELLVIYLKLGFEEAPSLFSLWSQHLWGAVEASSRPLSSHPGCRKGGKVRGDLSLAQHHLFFSFFFAWPVSLWAQIITIYRLLLQFTFVGSVPTPHPDCHVGGWEEREGGGPLLYISTHLCKQKDCLHLTDKLQTHAHTLFFLLENSKSVFGDFPIEIYINKAGPEAIFKELKLDILHLCGLNVKTFLPSVFLSHSIS